MTMVTGACPKCGQGLISTTGGIVCGCVSSGESYNPDRPKPPVPSFREEVTKALADIFTILYDLILRVNSLVPEDESDMSGQRVDWRMEKSAEEGMKKWTSKVANQIV